MFDQIINLNAYIYVIIDHFLSYSVHSPLAGLPFYIGPKLLIIYAMPILYMQYFNIGLHQHWTSSSLEFIIIDLIII